MGTEADRWRLVEELFCDVLDVSAPERRAFVERRAAGDAALTQEVLALVEAHTRTHPLLDSPAVADLPAGMRLGPYALERVIGSGGMATVYLAHRADRQFEKQVAVKLVNRGLTAEIIGDRFKTERQILARLEHPHIARLLDAGLSEFGQPFLVMEWVDGVTLDEWIARERPSINRRFDLWLDIAAAVGYAHQNLVIHRDLKPSNVLVGRDGIVKLVDFGIAKLAAEQGEGTATTQTIVFTPMYASPEQIDGRPVTTATDIYALGLLLYELTIGVHPFRREGQSAHEQTHAALLEEPAIPAGTPGDLAAILRMALRKEPERRYATAAAFADDVRRYRRGLPVIAQPETVAYRASKFVARHRLAVGVAAAVAISLVSLTAVALGQARRAQRQLVRAEKVTEFLSSMMGVTPEGTEPLLRSKGASLRVVELVDAVAQRMDRGMEDLPEVEAALRYVAGSVYNQLGSWDRADLYAGRAVELSRRIYPAGDPRRTNAEILQGTVLTYLGRFAEAEQLLLAVEREWVNPTPYMRAATCAELGISQLRLGKLDAAEQTLQTCVSSLEHAHGSSDEFLPIIMSDLGLVYLDRGQFELAKRSYEHAVGLARSSGNAESLGWTLINLANTYRHMSEPQPAGRYAEEAYGHFVKALGDTNPSAAHAISTWAWAKAVSGEADAETEGLIRKGVALQEKLPADHPDRAIPLTALGVVLMHENKLSEARPALERALAIRRKRFAAPNWRIAETAGYLGEVLARSGDKPAARPLLRENLEMFNQLWGPANPHTRAAQERWDRWQ